MNVEHLLTSTAVVTFTTADPDVLDDFGDPTTTTTSRSFRCWLSQIHRAEATSNQDVQQETWVLYLDATAADVDGFDRVTVDGKTYDVAGPPWPAINPRTRQLTHVECTVRRTR